MSTHLRHLILGLFTAIISANMAQAEEISAEEIATEHEALEVAAAAPTSLIQKLAPDRAQVPEVLQDQYLVASASEYPAIQTFGVTTCIAVTIYDPQLRQGAMLHVSASTNIPQAVTNVIEELRRRGSNSLNLQVQMYGGWGDSMSGDPNLHYNSRQMANQLYFELSQTGAVIIQNVTVTEITDTDRPAIYDVELNLQNGAVYRFLPSIPYNRASPARPLPTNPLHGG